MMLPTRLRDMNIEHTQSYTDLPTCLACGSSSLVPLLDLGEQPLANSYIKAGSPEPRFPLSSRLCVTCFHAQQAVAVHPDLMFKSYAYVSGTSATLKQHFEWLAARTISVMDPGNGSKLLSIASNDGSELIPFLKRGWDCTGVDPAENLADRAVATGARIITDYWNETTAENLNTTYDAIIAQNVFAHVSDPLAFLHACKKVMRANTKLFIQTSQAHMFERNEFDTMYHEHISFFSVRSMRALARRAGLTLSDVRLVPIHGESYLFTLTTDPHEVILPLEDAEQSMGRYSQKIYADFAVSAQTIARDAHDAVEKARAEGRTVVGYGAAAKGNTVLNFGKIALDWIVDDNPLKQGLYTPGMHIPIVASDQLRTAPEGLVIIPLAWNFFDEIRQRITRERPDAHDTYLTFFPSVGIVT